MEDDGIDVWKGTEVDKGVNAIICTIDLTQKAWAKVRDGQIIRAYAYLEESGKMWEDCSN